MNQQELKIIYIVRRGWHTGIFLKSEDIKYLIPILSSYFSESVYYEIGWGDSDYYQAEKATISLALKAIFLSRGSILHIVGFNEKPEEYFKGSEFRKISVELTGYINLIKFIDLSFYRGRNEEIIKIKDLGNSQFYQAVGKYGIFNTCNKWIAKALSSAGFKINPFFKLTSSSIINYLDKEIILAR